MDSADPIYVVLQLLFLAVIAALYFLPTIVAFARSHQAGMVFVLNLFLGWTLVGWVIALAIAVGSKPAAATILPGQPLLSPDGRFWWDGRAWRPVTPPPPLPRLQEPL
jgi:hypothetical protein